MPTRFTIYADGNSYRWRKQMPNGTGTSSTDSFVDEFRAALSAYMVARCHPNATVILSKEQMDAIKDQLKELPI